MKVLIVDAFGPSARSRRKFKNFVDVVTSSLTKTLHSFGYNFTLLKRAFHSLDGFDLSIASKYQATLREIDKLDLVFIDGDLRLLPWTASNNKLLMLIKACIMARKCVFAAASASLFVAHLCACGYRYETIPFCHTHTHTRFAATNISIFNTRTIEMINVFSVSAVRAHTQESTFVDPNFLP